MATFRIKTRIYTVLHKLENSISKKVRERKLVRVFSEFFSLSELGYGS